MKTTNFNWGDETIDSRDIIGRHEELQDEYNSLVEDLEEATEDFENFLKVADEELTERDEDFEEKCLSFNEIIQDAHNALNEFDKEELDLLTEVISQGENSPDWSYGEALILENYFTTYIKELVNDCYEMPTEFTDGKWPYRHITIDFDAAAEEAKQDYFSVEAGGETYWIRS
jgi:hypothetical protein